jgi:23S rRNA pseudouridine2605 synthase
MVTEMGKIVDPQSDRVEFDGHLVKSEQLIYIMLNKPPGFICTADDPQGRRTVLDLVKEINQRIYPVGRLDYDTEGILLLTNDGHFTNLIIHPRYKIDKKYEVKVKGMIEDSELKSLRNGVRLEDGLTAPSEVKVINRNEKISTIELIIHEGRKRQVKRMCAAVGHPVINLKRTALGFLTLEGLGRGQYRYLSNQEINRLIVMASNEFPISGSI